MVRAAAKNWQHVGDRRRPGRLRARCSPSSTRAAARCRTATRFALAQQGVLAHGRLRRRDLELAHRARPRRRGGGVPRPAQPAGGEGAGPALRREPAPAGGVLPRRDARRPGGIATYRQLQGKELSYNNIGDSRRRVGVREDLRRPRRRRRLRDRQARESLRRGDRRHAARGLPQGVRDRSGLGVRRHHRVQPAGRRGDARGGVGAVPRGADRARLHRRRARGDREEGERARARGRAARRRGAPAGSWDWKRVGGGLLVQTRRRAQRRRAAELRVVTRKAPTAAQLADLLFAWRVAKFVKSNAIVYCGGGQDARRRRRPDEPRRLGAHRRDQGAATPACRSPARSSRRTRSSRSATGSTSSPTTARSP